MRFERSVTKFVKTSCGSSTITTAWRHSCANFRGTIPTVYTIVEGAAETVVVTAVAIYRTTLDGGETKLFAIGRYTDALAHTVDGWRFRSRDLRLETRSLGIGTHYPL
jgi:hypothetical protein